MDAGDFNLEAIPEPPEPPTDDSLARKEELNLSPGKHLKYIQREYISELRSQLKECRSRERQLQKNAEELTECQIQLAELKTKDRFLQLIIVICFLAIGIGGLMTSSGDQTVKIAGYCLAGLGLVIQFFVGIFRTQAK